MPITFHIYNHAEDYEQVGRFLTSTWDITEGHVNWMQPRWEYMHFHPLINEVQLDSIGVWREANEIVAVVHPEHEMGVAYFELHPDYQYLKQDLLTHAESQIKKAANGFKELGVYANDADADLQSLLEGRGYANTGRRDPISRLMADRITQTPPIPEGFSLQSLAEDNDLSKVNRCLWRGFDHGDEPLENSLWERRLMQSAPNYRKDLNLVVVAPEGNFVAYCGMWLEPVHRIAYVEPVATDPDYRRKGLGAAVVLEGVRRCVEQGASTAYVGSTMPFYLSMGFEQVYNSTLWVREWH